MSGLLFAGNVYLDVLTDAGVSTGFQGPINSTSLAIQVQDPDEKTRQSMLEESYGQALDTVLIPKPQKIQLSFDDQPASLVALGLGGAVADYSQGAVTDEAISVVAHLDKWVGLGYRNIASGGVEHATWVEDTDFVVDSVRGLVKFLSTGSATEGATVPLTVTAAAVTAKRISGSTRPTFYASIMLDGINKADGQRGHLNIMKANLAPSGDVDPITGEFMVTTLKGTLITPEGESAPYFWDIEEVHA